MYDILAPMEQKYLLYFKPLGLYDPVEGRDIGVRDANAKLL